MISHFYYRSLFVFLFAAAVLIIFHDGRTPLKDVKKGALPQEFARFMNGNRSFSYKHLPILNDLDLVDPKRCTKNGIYENNITFVSAWSHNHHSEAYNLATSLREYKGNFLLEITPLSARTRAKSSFS